MLDKSGSFIFRIESYTCDFTEKATLTGIGGYILDAASRHAEERGFGYGEILKDNVAWVLSRLSIKMDKYPAFNRTIKVETWVESVEKFFTQRCFCIYDEDNTILGYARTIWAAINIETRRPIDIPRWRPELSEYAMPEKECPIEKFSKIPAIEGIEPSMGYSVRYSDIDINKHMNSIKYIEHIVDVFDLALFKEKMIHRFEIIYLAEGMFGDKLKLYRQHISENENLVDTRRGEESVCRSRIIWK
ncbi:MAG: acyl-[acyl-carrier-protein] thioesterase [Dysgonamonadaceae bacterium]|jgi:acyl-ACP thioesterase|nr:acyl-[acyl-carrier-protein] thioesterase [Dysgonamonadaceae bacterium]